MQNQSAFFVISPGPRPPFIKVADYCWGEGADIDSDGNSDYPDDPNWTELTLTLRSDYIERVDIDPISEDPLILKVSSESADLAKRVAEFLSRVTEGRLVEKAPNP